MVRLVFIKSAKKFFLGGLALGLGIGFVRYFDHWVFFPTLPNILDSITMLVIGVFLLYESVKGVNMESSPLPNGWRARWSLTDLDNLAQFNRKRVVEQ